MTNSNNNLPEGLPVGERHSSPLLLKKWYRLTAPPEPPQSASFAQRETARRGRLTSAVLLFYSIILLILLSVGLFSPSIAGIPVAGALLICSIALLFNRFSHPNVAGFLITSYVFVSVVLTILSAPGGLSTATLGLFYTLVFVEVLAASLLSVNWVLLTAFVNIVFVIIDLSLQRRGPEFALLMSTDSYTVISRIIVLHLFVALVLWLCVRSATQAIRRADRAEELAMRERQIQELQQAKLQQKEELEKGIELILQTHVQVSNGNFQARAPLSQDSLLWRVAYSLNNLIGRLQNYSQLETELRSARHMIAFLNNELQKARRTTL